MNRAVRRRVRLAFAASAVGLVLALVPVLGDDGRGDPADWVSIDYSELLDRRQPTHSGEAVGVLLQRLGGRPLPRGGERPADRMDHGLLDPLVEPYAFVLSDAMDTLEPVHDPPLVELGSLWRPGERQPAWVELLRARRYVVESDGEGSLRVFVPLPDTGSEGETPLQESGTAARSAWDDAWPVLRHALAAERLRLASAGIDRPLEVEVHAYRHLRARSTFVLGVAAQRVTVEDTRPDGRRPPLALAAIRSFLDGNLELQGGRIVADGSLKLLGSTTDGPTPLLGQPLDIADVAAAYRAVFHGGLAEPYMSLDRGYSPQRSNVSYGGRLRDTSLGLVSLLCDIRFKTFSLGLDIVEGRDVREELRGALPDFRTHLEHLSAHPDSAGMAGQQTRLWFYPDKVDLTLSPQGDVLVMRNVRMSAASERVAETGERAAGGGDPPWTRDTVAAINRDYDTLAGIFPEMADLDQVVRLLSLFTWLRQLEAEGSRLPELESLLAFELPQLSTPRSYPQLLAFNALPPANSGVEVESYDRVPVAEALDRLDPLSGRPLPAIRRYRRAVATLDRSQPEQVALMAEFERMDVSTLDESLLDLLAYRAQRLRMHQRVLATLDPVPRQGLAERLQSGEQLRIFSVGVGGLDLGMGQALDRAQGRRLGFTPGTTGGEGSEQGSVARTGPEGNDAREAWRSDPAALPAVAVPDHGLGGQAKSATLRRFGNHFIEVGPNSGLSAEHPPTRWIRTVLAADAPEVRSRRVDLDDAGRAVLIERVEEMRLLRYRFARAGSKLMARREPVQITPSPDSEKDEAALPPGLVLLRLNATRDDAAESPEVGVRLDFMAGGARRSVEADFPRALLQRLVIGKDADMTPGRPLPGFSPLPEPLGDVTNMMVIPDPARWRPPWESPPAALPGEEDPIRVARALDNWWASEGRTAPSASVGIDPRQSPTRWASSPMAGDDALLLLPSGAFPPTWSTIARDVGEAWASGRVVESLPLDPATSLVVVVSAEPPGVFASRLRDLARDPLMKGRVLAAWCLAGPVRADLPASLLGEGNLAGLGLAEASVVGRREASEWISSLRRALDAGGGSLRPDRMPGPFLWYY